MHQAVGGWGHPAQMRGRQEVGVPGMGWVLLARARVMGLQQGGEAIGAGDWLRSEGPWLERVSRAELDNPGRLGAVSREGFLALLTCMSACT